MPDNARDLAIARALAREQQMQDIINDKNANLRNTMQTDSNDDKGVVSKRISNPNSVENVAEIIAIAEQNKTSEDAWQKWETKQNIAKIMKVLPFIVVGYFVLK